MLLAISDKSSSKTSSCIPEFEGIFAGHVKSAGFNGVTEFDDSGHKNSFKLVIAGTPGIGTITWGEHNVVGGHVDDDFVVLPLKSVAEISEEKFGSDPNKNFKSSACFSAIFKIFSDLSEILYFFRDRNAFSNAFSGSSELSELSEFLFRFLETIWANCLLCSSCPFWIFINISHNLSSLEGEGVMGLLEGGGGGGAVVVVVVVVVTTERDFLEVFFPEVRQDLETTWIGKE